MTLTVLNTQWTAPCKRLAMPLRSKRSRAPIPAQALFRLFGKDKTPSSSSDSTTAAPSTPSSVVTEDRSASSGASSGPASGPTTTTSIDMLDDVVLIQTDSGDGTVARIVYRNGGTVDAYELDRLCEKVGWPRRPIHKVEAALRNSFMVSTIMMETGPAPASPSAPFRASTSRLIGLARATSDHAFNATIWDVLVDPEFQGQGLGKSMVEHMVRSLLRREIGNITLFADAQVVDFYRGLGFEADPEGIKGMFWYPRL